MLCIFLVVVGAFSTVFWYAPVEVHVQRIKTPLGTKRRRSGED